MHHEIAITWPVVCDRFVSAMAWSKEKRCMASFSASISSLFFAASAFSASECRKAARMAFFRKFTLTFTSDDQENI